VTLYLGFLRWRGVVVPLRRSVLAPALALAIAWAATNYAPAEEYLQWGAILLVWAVPLLLLRSLRRGDLSALRAMVSKRTVEG
jgi:hypothetical protein